MPSKRPSKDLRFPSPQPDFFAFSHSSRSRLNSAVGKSIHGGPPQPQFAYRKGSRPLLETEARSGFSSVVFDMVGCAYAGLEDSVLPDFSELSVFSLPVTAALMPSCSTSVLVSELSDSVEAVERTDTLSESTGMVKRVS